MKSDILNIHLTNSIHRINDSIKNRSYIVDIILPTNFVCSRYFVQSRGHYGRLSRPLFTPRWLIVVMLNYRSHLNIKEIDHTVFITKMVHAMFHETASRKLRVFTLYDYPYMSNGVSHFNILDELITTFGGLFFGVFLFIQILANNSGKPDPTPTSLCGVLSGSALFANVPQNWSKA